MPVPRAQLPKIKIPTQWLHRLKTPALLISSGALMVTAMPPIGFFPALFICLPILMRYIVKAPSLVSAFLRGWGFGCGYFIAGLFWFGTAFKSFFTDAGWALPIVLIVVPAYIALCYGVAAACAWPFRLRRFFPLAFAGAMFWAEYVRGHYLINFPWNTLGYGWHHVLPVLQTTSLFGIYGLTFATLLWSTAAQCKSMAARGLLILSLLAAAAWGFLRLQQHPTELTSYNFRLIQPNIMQEQKENSWFKDDVLKKQLDLTQAPAEFTIHAVVWPETAVDVSPENGRLMLHSIAEALPEEDTLGLIGVNMFTPKDGKVDVRNRIIVTDKQAHILGAHDKFTLAPWGEYVPYREYLTRLSPFAHLFGGMTDLTPGTGPSTLHIGNLPSFSTIICIESAFSARMTDPRQRPDFLLFITNDAWSSHTLGPYQHFGMARVRSIEEGLPILRSANTGISAAIDPFGRILQTIQMYETGFIDVTLPQKTEPTLFCKTGDTLTLQCLILLMIFLTGLHLLLPPRKT